MTHCFSRTGLAVCMLMESYSPIRGNIITPHINQEKAEFVTFLYRWWVSDINRDFHRDVNCASCSCVVIFCWEFIQLFLFVTYNILANVIRSRSEQLNLVDIWEPEQEAKCLQMCSNLLFVRSGLHDAILACTYVMLDGFLCDSNSKLQGGKKLSQNVTLTYWIHIWIICQFYRSNQEKRVDESESRDWIYLRTVYSSSL